MSDLEEIERQMEESERRRREEESTGFIMPWYEIGVSILDKSVPDEALQYLLSRGWTTAAIKRAGLRYIKGQAIASRWWGVTVRKGTGQTGKAKGKKNAPPEKPDRYFPTGGIVLPMADDYGVIRVFYRVEHGEPSNKFVMPALMAAPIHIPHHVRKTKLLAGGKPSTPAAKRAPFVIVESHLKAELAASHRIPCIGINGCFGWRQTKADGMQAAINNEGDFEPAIRPDILKLWHQGRSAILQVDGDFRSNLNVRRALLSFVDLALTAGRVPLVRPLPDNMGIDDWIAQGHTKADYDALPTYGADSAFVRMLRAPFHPCTETGLGDRFVDYHGYNTFYDPKTDMWYSHVDDKGWSVGETIPNERMLEVARSLAAETAAERNPGMKQVRQTFDDDCAHTSTQNMALKQAVRTGKIKIDAAEFDAEPDLIGVKNGVLRLSDRKLLVPTPDLKVTRACPVAYDPTLRSKVWERFIDRASDGNKGLLRLYQEIAGAALLGRADRNEVIFNYGVAFTGKSIFLEAQMDTLGPDYAVASKAEIILKSRRDNDPERSTPFRMSLRGKRLITCSELGDNAVIDDAALKDLTGGDTITARNNYAGQVQFRNTARVQVRGNGLPNITGTSEAVWSRVMVVPFNVVIPAAERDPDLRRKIQAEGAGVLNWMIEGLQRYAERGYKFEQPKIVQEVMAKYRRDSDWLGAWFLECVASDPKKDGATCKELQAEVTDSVMRWRERNGHEKMSSKTIWERIRTHLGGYDPVYRGDKGVTYAKGFNLRRGQTETTLLQAQEMTLTELRVQVELLKEELAERDAPSGGTTSTTPSGKRLFSIN